MDIIKNKTGLPPRENIARINQQRMLPTAVPTRILGQIIGGEPASTALGSATTATSTIPDASSGTFLITTADEFKRVLFGAPDVSIYIGSVTDANEWPNATYGMGNMPISFFPGVWGLSDNANVVSRLVIRNNTGGSVDVIIKYRIRLITNPVASQEQANV